MQMIDGFGWTIRMAGELESDSVALERVREYEDLPQEADWESVVPLAEHWPSTGEIKFDGYATKYRPELPCVLENFNLDVSDNEKVGIVGRTGAGKSSLSLALFRMIEPSKGVIRIDGRDITTIGLQDLRARLTIIPQEPTLFSGSLRFNLDPGNHFSDEALHRAIHSAGLTELVAELSGGLEHKVSEGGAGLSLGQRQLICLARALLRRSKVLVLDEATAAVDTATDERIQTTIRTEFASCTVLTIAHRLNTVTGGDTVLVLDKGKLAEQGSPESLLGDPSSQFHGMARAAGILESHHLHDD
jgi:ABC-type multidrug transport system fused ATPase/permease subunit